MEEASQYLNKTGHRRSFEEDEHMKKTVKTNTKASAKTAAKAEASVKETTVKTAAKETVKAETPVKESEKAPAAETETVKEAVSTKAVAEADKKAPAKKAAIKEAVYLQYQGKEISQQDIVKQIKEIWTKQLKNKVGDIKSITIYLKPEENTAYYVVNDEVKGNIEL